MLPVALLEVAGVIEIEVLLEAGFRARIVELIFGDAAVVVAVELGECLGERREDLLRAGLGLGREGYEVDGVAVEHRSRLDLPRQAADPPELLSGTRVVTGEP